MQPAKSIGRRVMTCVAAVAGAFAVGGCTGDGPPSFGAVVVSCERGEAAEVAGLQASDVVVGWSQGAEGGRVESPFHLRAVEQDRAPSGPVELEVRRGSQELLITIPTGRWRVALRPVLDRKQVARTLEAREAERAGDLAAAADLWRELAGEAAGAPRGLEAAWLDLQLGVALALEGRDDESGSALERGAGAVVDDRLRAVLWERAGDALLKAGRRREAASTFLQAMDLLAARDPDSPAVAFLQLQLCRSDFRACDTEAARALEIYREVDATSIEVAQSHACLGTWAFFRADLDAAEAAYRQGLSLVREVAAGRPLECELLGNLGLVAMRRGDLDGARAFFQHNMEAAERLGPGTKQFSHAANYLGLLAKKAGRYELAASYYEKALASFEASNPGGPEVAGVLTNLGNVAIREKSFRAARHYHRQALELRRRLEPGGAEVASSLSNLGVAARLMGDLEAAREHLEQALEIKLEISPGTPWTANTIFELGEVAREEGRLDEAERHHLRALEIRRQISPDQPAVAESLFALGAVEKDRGNLTEVERLWRESIRIIDRQRLRITASAESRTRFGAVFYSFQGALARLLADTGRAPEAWFILEAARGAALRSMLAQRDTMPASVPPELWFAKTRAETRMARIESRLASIDPARDEEALRRYRDELLSVEKELESISERIREIAPLSPVLAGPRPMSLTELRGSLDEGTVVLSYSVGKERTMLLVTGAAADGAPAIQIFEIAAGERELAGRVERFNALIGRGQTQPAVEPAIVVQGQRLFDLLVGPASEAISGFQRVLVIPDGPLHQLAFAALVLPGDDAPFLGCAKPLVVSPSATLGVDLATRPAQPAKRRARILALGDPDYRSGSALIAEHRLCPIPGSRAEIEAIRRLYGERATVFLGEAASEANLKANAPVANVIHCAVHARIDPHLPMDSSLFFSQPAGGADASEDGVLSGWEIIDGVRLDADVVVLSACSGGSGRVVPGEGVLGLAYAFHVAGARTVVASHWAAPDRSTAELMIAFYEQLQRGRNTAEALQLARQAVAGTPGLEHPFNWAGFEVRGSWR